MMVSVLVSAATIESEIAHQGMSRSGEKIIAQRVRCRLRKRSPKQRDAREIQPDNYEISFVEAHVRSRGRGSNSQLQK